MAFKVCCKCSTPEVVNLKRFDTADGTLMWQRLLFHPQVSLDNKIWGMAVDFSENFYDGKTFTTADTFSNTLSTQRHAKAYWVQINSTTGEIEQTSDRFLYYAINSLQNAVQPAFFPFFGTGSESSENALQPNLYTVNADGDCALPYGGTSIRPVVVKWDNGNTTFTRTYTLWAAPLRDSTISLSLTAAADGTNAVRTQSITGLQGMSASSFASAVEAAFPDHVISCTATGGPYPFSHIDFEIEWFTNNHHFTNTTISASGNLFPPHLRNLLTHNITAGAAVTYERDEIGVADKDYFATMWQLLDSGDLVGISPRFVTAGQPSDSALRSSYVERWTLSGSDITPDWSVIPLGTGSTQLQRYGRRPALFRPNTAGGRLFVSHDPASASALETKRHITELDLSDGSILGKQFAGTNFSYPVRATLNPSNQWVCHGLRSILPSDLAIQLSDNTFCSDLGATTVSALDAGSYSMTHQASYGVLPQFSINFQAGSGYTWTNNRQWPMCSDGTRLFYDNVVQAPRYDGVYAGASAGFPELMLFPKGTTITQDQTLIVTVTGQIYGTEHNINNGAAWFPHARYYEKRLTFTSFAGGRWYDDNLEWRIVSSSVADYTTSDAVYYSTDWLAFDATITDVNNAIDTAFGRDTFDEPNARALENADVVQTTSFPHMMWEHLYMEIKQDFPDPAIPDYDLAERTNCEAVRIQIRSTEYGKFLWIPEKQIGAINLTDGTVEWSQTWGAGWPSRVTSTVSNSTIIDGGLITQREIVRVAQGPETVVFNSSGTWLCPPGVRTVDVRAFGGGGGGGGTDTLSGSASGGGGGGAFAKKTVTVTPGTTYTVTVGTGGAGGVGDSSPGNGADGGDSWFSTSSTIKAVGGKGGLGASLDDDEAGGDGGLAANCIGDAKWSGGDGADGLSTQHGGGGGASAANGIDGNDAAAGVGGVASTGGGSGGNEAEDGATPGGGGGGTQGGGGGGNAGGDGAHGRIILIF